MLESKASPLSNMDRSEDPDGKLLDHVQASVSSLIGHLASDAVSCPIVHRDLFEILAGIFFI